MVDLLVDLQAIGRLAKDSGKLLDDIPSLYTEAAAGPWGLKSSQPIKLSFFQSEVQTLQSQWIECYVIVGTNDVRWRWLYLHCAN